MPPDDLPRSPTGRVPQWVVDQAAGRPVEPDPWRSPSPQSAVGALPSRRRRRRKPVLVGLAIVALAGASWLYVGAPGLAPGTVSALASDLGLSHAAAVAPPSADVVALADEAHLSAAGKALFYGTNPKILGAGAFAGQCGDGQAQRALSAGSIVGCFEQGSNSIVLYEPADPRLHGSVVTSAAHETLHAAWAQLTAAQQSELTPLLSAEVASIPTADPIHEQIAGSVGTHPDHLPTEMFAYVGTQDWRTGGLAPQLEAAYARVISDRAALVAVYTGWNGMLDKMATDIQSASQALATRQTAHAQSQAQYDADAASVDYYRKAYQAKVAQVAAMPASQQARLELSWVWWDGTKLPMAPAKVTLASAAALLARDDAALPQREAALQSEAAAIAAEHARVQSLVSELQGLQNQLDPSSTAS